MEITTETATTFTDWMRAQFDTDQLNDIVNHGADAGFSGLIYTRECVALFDRFADEIWDMAVNDAADLGCKNVADMIAGFNRSDMLESWDQFRNLMAWYAAERIAAQLVNA